MRPINTSPDGIAAVSRLLRAVSPAATHVTPECLDWQYNRNPAGAVIGSNAFVEGYVDLEFATSCEGSTGGSPVPGGWEPPRLVEAGRSP